MNIGAIKDIMETYTELTKITTICMDTSQRKIPLYIKGLDFAFLLGYTEYGEVIEFLGSKNKYLYHDENNMFYTLYTKSNYIYNIVLMKMDENTNIGLIAGPMINIVYDGEFKEDTAPDFNILKNKRILVQNSTLPVITEKSIYSLGKLLMLLLRMQASNDNPPIQKIYRRKNDVILHYGKINDYTAVKVYTNEYKKIYQILINIMHKIRDGDTSGIGSIVTHNISLLAKGNLLNDNIRSVKDKCIVICTIACYTALQTNAPFDRMLDILIKAVLKIEKMQSNADIIQIMISTLERYTRIVKALSEEHYSIHIRHALQYIHNHYSEKITLQKLADYIHINPVYLSSLLKKETNLSLSNHINLIRIEKSKSLLTGTNKSIQEIAFLVGYNYQNHYNMLFKRHEGITPTEYRRNHGKK